MGFTVAGYRSHALRKSVGPIVGYEIAWAEIVGLIVVTVITWTYPGSASLPIDVYESRGLPEIDGLIVGPADIRCRKSWALNRITNRGLPNRWAANPGPKSLTHDRGPAIWYCKSWAAEIALISKS